MDRLGLKTIRAMGGEEVQASVHSPTYRMALSEEHCAVLHPAKLARGLADSVVRKGAALFERAGSATLVDEGNRVRVDTVSGPIYAKQAVIATNAWTARNPAFSRWLIPMYTYIIATEPLSEATWAEIGWDGSEGIEDKRVHLHYYRRTLDGRILWGGRDNTATFNNAIGTRYDRNEHIFGLLQASFAATFPQLSDVRFTHAWGGPIALTPDFLPRFGSTSAASTTASATAVTGSDRRTSGARSCATWPAARRRSGRVCCSSASTVAATRSSPSATSARSSRARRASGTTREGTPART